MANARQRYAQYIAGSGRDGHGACASRTKQALYHLLVGIAVPAAAPSQERICAVARSVRISLC
jgi:hypothetical protein